MLKNFVKPHKLLIALISFITVLLIHNPIPFFLQPTAASDILATGFSESLTNNNSLFNFYAYEFGIPKPAAETFGLEAIWPMSLLIRFGFHTRDAYVFVFSFWVGVSMISTYLLARQFGNKKLYALFLVIILVTIPIAINHHEYSMLSLGIILLPFYFLAAFKIFYIEKNDLYKSKFSSIVFCIIATVVFLFLHGCKINKFCYGEYNKKYL